MRIADHGKRGSSHSESQPPTLRTPPSGGKRETAAFPVSSFRAEARNLFRSRSGKRCEESGERETPLSLRLEITVFHADRFTKGKRQTGNEKDPLTALGMTIRGKAYLTFFSTHSVSQPPPLRTDSFRRREARIPLPHNKAFSVRKPYKTYL